MRGRVEPYTLCVLAVILMGANLRFYYGLAHSTVPAGTDTSGGLFIHFAEQIIANDFRLPAHIPFYTDGGIPFAYPPLAFYIEAVVIQVTSLDPMLAIRLLPAAISTASIAALCLMLRVMELPRWTALAVLALYALLAPNYTETAEPSGLAEAMGIAALILLLTAVTHNHRRNTAKTQVLVGLARAFSKSLLATLSEAKGLCAWDGILRIAQNDSATTATLKRPCGGRTGIDLRPIPSISLEAISSRRLGGSSAYDRRTHPKAG